MPKPPTGRFHIHLGPHWATYWWGGEISWTDKTTWPLWYIEWGGKREHGCHLLAMKIRIRWRFYGFSIW